MLLLRNPKEQDNNHGKYMRAKDLIVALNRKFGKANSNQLAPVLGMTYQSLRNWSGAKGDVTPLKIANCIDKARKAAIKEAQKSTIKPIVEFFPIDAVESRGGNYYELFSTKESHPLYNGLRKELEKSKGIYIFYDSQGHALYVGKARQLTLWKELNNAFNRDRKESQKIRLVSHPERKQEFTPAYKQERKITSQYALLHELAHYFSAYEVDDGMINMLEAFLVRGFANNLLNKKMESLKN